MMKYPIKPHEIDIDEFDNEDDTTTIKPIKKTKPKLDKPKVVKKSNRKPSNKF